MTQLDWNTILTVLLLFIGGGIMIYLIIKFISLIMSGISAM